MRALTSPLRQLLSCVKAQGESALPERGAVAPKVVKEALK